MNAEMGESTVQNGDPKGQGEKRNNILCSIYVELLLPCHRILSPSILNFTITIFIAFFGIFLTFIGQTRAFEDFLIWNLDLVWSVVLLSGLAPLMISIFKAHLKLRRSAIEARSEVTMFESDYERYAHITKLIFLNALLIGIMFLLMILVVVYFRRTMEEGEYLKASMLLYEESFHMFFLSWFLCLIWDIYIRSLTVDRNLLKECQ